MSQLSSRPEKQTIACNYLRTMVTHLHHGYNDNNNYDNNSVFNCSGTILIPEMNKIMFLNVCSYIAVCLERQIHDLPSGDLGRHV